MTELQNRALSILYELEGFYSDDKKDTGGATKYGISLTFLRMVQDDATAEDVRNLTLDDTTDLYLDFFWTHYFDEIPERVAIVLFLLAVNAGASRAYTIMQLALKKMGHKISADGVIGPNTAKAIRVSNTTELIKRFTVETIKFYIKLDRPRFIDGWIYRAVSAALV